MVRMQDRDDLRRPSRRGGVLFVGGGTVGHLAPAFALADALEARGAQVHFATPGEGDEEGWFPPERPGPHHTSPAPRLPRAVPSAVLFPPRLLHAVERAGRLLRRIEPEVVVGLGGWPCVPAVLAARLRGTPACLVASDARAGTAVRRLAGLAARIYAAQPEAAVQLGRPDRTLVTGPVVRPAIGVGRRDPPRFGLEPDRYTLLVTGGSLGALALNERVVAGLTEAVEADPRLRERIQVLHAVGRSGAGVESAYRALGIRHHVRPFLREMGHAYATADLVVCRAGALTCAELEAAGRPSVLVPYPHHRDRQQHENARRLVERGGALLVEEEDLTPEIVRDRVLKLLRDREALDRMAHAARRGASDGLRQITDDLVRFLRRVDSPSIGRETG